MIRWHAIIVYRTEGGPIDVEHGLDELSELHDLVERGPHWDCIERISVHRVNHNTSKRLTIEEAQQI